MASVTSYPDYNLIAPINNEYYSQKYLETNLPILKYLLLEHIPKTAKILDICCGVGRLVQKLLLEGYQVTGIDSSEEMLRYARQNATTAEFILSDVRFFELPSKFQGAISTGALNHIISLEELTNVFRNVYSALELNGLFVFNLLLEEEFESDWDGWSFGDAIDDCAWIIRHHYESVEKMGKIKITGFQLIEGNWKRLDNIMLFKAYSSVEVLSALKSVGFREVNIHSFKDDSVVNQKSIETYFVSYK